MGKKKNKTENKNIKNKVILCLIGTIFGLIKVPSLFLLEQKVGFSNWISFAYIVIYYIAFHKNFQSFLRAFSDFFEKYRMQRWGGKAAGRESGQTSSEKIGRRR